MDTLLKEEQVHDMFQKMISEFGTIDILINNAGIQKDAAFDEMSLDQWNLVLRQVVKIETKGVAIRHIAEAYNRTHLTTRATMGSIQNFASPSAGRTPVT